MPASESNVPTDSDWVRIAPRSEHPFDWGATTRALRAGDETSFDVLYTSYCDRLYGYLLVLTRGQDELAREVLQGTWIKVLNTIPQIEQESKLWNWLATVARNCCFDVLRRRQRAPSVVPLTEEQPLVEVADDAHLYECLELSLQALEPDDQCLVRGFYFKGQSHQELAQHTGSTTKAVESKLARLRHALHRTLLKHLSHEKL